MKHARILIVDDEQIARENLDLILKKEGYETLPVESGIIALQALEKTEFDLVITDLKMQIVDGLQVLEKAKELNPYTEVIVITGYATVATAVDAMQKGAFYYLPKPVKIDEVRILVRQALEKRSLRKEVADLKLRIGDRKEVLLVTGNNPKMESLKKTVEQIAPTDCTVLILGETGTGKELIARTIHRLSNRSEKRFMAVNCGAFNEELLANELFGHEKEAFTGARGIKKGLLEAANGGTVFLDEIGDMPLSMQVKLLRVIQERTIIRVGGTDDVPVDLRVIAATNKDLAGEIEGGSFRRDLYYRLNVITLHVPPLAERKESIPVLCRHFLRKFSDAQNKNVVNISDDVSDMLMSYEFPGNIRELENIIEHAVAMAETDTVEMRHLPADFQQLKFRIASRRQREFLTLEENEMEYIAWVLEQVDNKKSKAAEILGIDRVSLWRKLRRYNLDT
ncbi:MAG: sigma-54-dependent Fis family transcriptional regulator [Desulfobacteraceae bacterium]|nr:MAG: sigma-54-dependent Fis family transcriptional regulator [Desulfobacteraceae bacterium]